MPGRDTEELVEALAQLDRCEQELREQVSQNQRLAEELAAAAARTPRVSFRRRRQERRRKARDRWSQVNRWIELAWRVAFTAFGLALALCVVGGIIKRC
jgi:hypothetical protein